MFFSTIEYVPLKVPPKMDSPPVPSPNSIMKYQYNNYILCNNLHDICHNNISDSCFYISEIFGFINININEHIYNVKLE